MFKSTIIFLIGIVLSSFTIQNDYISEQKKYKKVRTAFGEKQVYLENKLNEHNIKLSNVNLLFVVFKDDDLLDVYAKSKTESSYRKILSYKICSRSGELGPKRKQGDRQVPEGFYHIDSWQQAEKKNKRL